MTGLQDPVLGLCECEGAGTFECEGQDSTEVGHRRAGGRGGGVWVPKGPWGEMLTRLGRPWGGRAGGLATQSEGLGAAGLGVEGDGGQRQGPRGDGPGVGGSLREAGGEMWEDGSQGQQGGRWVLA